MPPEVRGVDATASAEAAAKAAVLIESLPWIAGYAGRIVVVKFGGNAMVDEELIASFAEDVVYLRTVGVRPVVGVGQVEVARDAQQLVRGDRRAGASAAAGDVGLQRAQVSPAMEDDGDRVAERKTPDLERDRHR